jgi:hypothetical protein
MKKESLKDKIVSLVTSIRFWIITLSAISSYLAGVEKSGFSLPALFETIATYLGVVVGVGTVDAIITKIKAEPKA